MFPLTKFELVIFVVLVAAAALLAVSMIISL
jgi:cell division protein FtsL